MKELYSIGETAKLLGISVQTLRNYSDMKLLEPEYINNENGYRYYSFRQFHYIDRIKYLRRLGLSLAEIYEVFQEGDTNKLTLSLEKQKKVLEEEIREKMDVLDDIKWYIEYFKYIDRHDFKHIPYIVSFPKRYVMFVDHYSEDTVESVETRLAELKNKHDIRYRRQYGFVVDFPDLLAKKFNEKKYFIYLKEKPETIEEWLLELPEGEYMCFRGRVRTHEWDTSIVAEYFKDKEKPLLAIANEYEDNLVEYHHCPYEIQIPLNLKL